MSIAKEIRANDVGTMTRNVISKDQILPSAKTRETYQKWPRVVPLMQRHRSGRRLFIADVSIDGEPSD